MQDNNVPEWFLLDLPPINLYTANLLMPYYNGVEECRVNGIIQPEGIKHTNLLHSKVIELMDTIKGGMKKCQSKCHLDQSSLICIGCGRTIEEITAAGFAAKAVNNNKGEINMKQFTPEQQKLIVEYRNEYVKNCAEIDRLKENIKFGFESLFDRLGIDTKEDKETPKSIKLGFKLFYNESKDEQLSITENAAFIAEMNV